MQRVQWSEAERERRRQRMVSMNRKLVTA